MKKGLISLFFLLAMQCAMAQTQAAMNVEADERLKKVDTELNAVYQKILRDYGTDTAFLRAFKKAQRIWIQLRDAEMQARFPNREQGYYGSIFPLCQANYMQELTEDRIRKLKIWIVGIKEGNLCSGAVKTSE